MASASGIAKKSSAKKSAAGSGFMKPLTPSKELAQIVGDEPLPRSEAVSKMWAYIQKHKLPWPQAFDSKGWKGELPRKFAIEAIPHSYLIDVNGVVRKVGAYHFDCHGIAGLDGVPVVDFAHPAAGDAPVDLENAIQAGAGSNPGRRRIG